MDGEVFLSRANSTIFLSQTEEGLAISPLARVPQRTHPCVARRSPSPRRAGQGACRGASQGGGSQDGAGPGSGGGGGGARAGRGKEGRGQRGGGGRGGAGAGAGLTVAVSFVGAVLAVGLAVAAQAQVHALAPRAGELGGRAYRAALLVALVVTLGEAIAAPGPGDAVDLPGGTRELVRGAGGRLCGEHKHHHAPPRGATRCWASEQETVQLDRGAVPTRYTGQGDLSLSRLWPQRKMKVGS